MYERLLERVFDIHSYGKSRMGFVVEATLKTENGRRVKAGVLFDSDSNFHLIDRKWGDPIGLE